MSLLEVKQGHHTIEEKFCQVPAVTRKLFSHGVRMPPTRGADLDIAYSIN
jgi:hypothetical protein